MKVLLLAPVFAMLAIGLAQQVREKGGNSIALKRHEKRPEKGPESKFATSICMNAEKGPGLYCFGPFFTKEISFLIH